MSTGKLHAVAGPSAPPDLVARCQRGDKEALGELYRQYRAEVARNLHRMLGPGRGDLEDVLQEVFIEGTQPTQTAPKPGEVTEGSSVTGEYGD